MGDDMTPDMNLEGATVTRTNVYPATFPMCNRANRNAFEAATEDRRARINAAYCAMMSTPEGKRFRAIDDQTRDAMRRRDRFEGDPRYIKAYYRYHEMVATLSHEWNFAQEALEPLYDAYCTLVDDIINDRA